MRFDGHFNFVDKFEFYAILLVIFVYNRLILILFMCLWWPFGMCVAILAD